MDGRLEELPELTYDAIIFVYDAESDRWEPDSSYEAGAGARFALTLLEILLRVSGGR